MDAPREPLPPYAWDPTEGMSPEERLGFELISTLEGRLVTDDTFKAYTRALGKTVRTLHRQLVLTRWVAGALILASITLGAIATDAAEDARELAECNTARLEAVATRVIPQAPGCDMREIEDIVARALENARRQAELEREVARLSAK